MNHQHNNPNQYQMVPVYQNNELSPYVNQQPLELEEQEINLRDYWRVIVKWRWVILTFFITIVTTTVIGTMLTKPVYRSTITIQIDKENVALFSSEQGGLVKSDDFSDNYYNTQYQILRSRALAKKSVSVLKMGQGNEMSINKGKRPDQGTENILAPPAPVTFEERKAELKKKEEEDNKMVNVLLSSVLVEPIKGSRLVRVIYESTDPVFAAKAVNAIGKAYIDMSYESKFKTSFQAKEYLTKQLEDLKIKVERSEEKLLKYANVNEVISKDTQDSVISSSYEDLSSELTAAKSERIAKESLYNQINQKKGGLPDSITSLLYGKLKSEYQSTESEYEQMSKIFKKDYPKMKVLAAKLTHLKNSMEEEKRKIINNIKTEYMTAANKERSFQNSLNEQKKVIYKANESSIQYNILKRESETFKELYKGVLEKLKTADVTGGFNSANITILEEGLVPSAPFKPNVSKNIQVSIVLGLFIGILMAFILEYLDNTVKTPDDVEKKIKLPVLGLIPSLTSFTEQRKRGIKKSKEEDALIKQEIPERIELITNDKSKSTVSEAYRAIRTALQYSSSEKPPKVIVSTSATQSEGKTTSAVNLAVTFTQIGNKVILVDCDLRRPRLHNVFGLSNETGATSYLTGLKKLTDILQFTNIKNLDVICSGPIPPNPSELLSSEKMKELISELSKLYDTVIIDSPPVLGITDTTILSTICDGIMLVVKGAKTSRELVNKAKKQIQSVGGKILGVIINDIDLKKHDYSYYSNYYYYYSNDYIYSSIDEKPEQRN